MSTICGLQLWLLYLFEVMRIMKLNLAIIHLDMVVDTLELEPGEYSLGRSSKNNIVVQHFSLDPEQGEIYFEDDTWSYKDNQTKRVTEISNNEPLKITDQISIATREHVEAGQTRLSDFSVLRSAHQSKLNKRLAVAGSLVAGLILVTVIGYQAVRTASSSMNENKILNIVRDKVVEFEVKRDSKAIDEIKKYSGLTDADFKESSGFCTGFLVGPNIVLTAGHCLLGRLVVDLSNDFYIKTSDGEKHEIKEVLGFDVKRDFLFLRTETLESYGHLNFAESYQKEQKVFTVGNVHGEGIAIRDGIISSESTDPDEPDVKFLRYSAGTSPGNSGGPLVNAQGEVVALVFAATGTENFNLGTPTQDLREAYNKFVENDGEKQTINLAMRRVLNFKPDLMLQTLSLPYLPQFDEYPEVAQKLKEVSIDVEVPIEFSEVDKAILNPLNKAVIEAFFDVQKLLREKKEIVLDWKSFVSTETPAILPSQFDFSQNVFVKKNGRYYPQVAGLIDSPSKADYTKYKEQLKKEKKFDFQAYGYNILVEDKKVDLLDTDIFYKPKNSGGTKPRLLNLAVGTPYTQMIVFGDEDLRTKGFFGLKLFLKNFIGDGALATSYSRFIRPQSIKDFALKDLDIKKDQIQHQDVKDRLGRTWRRSRIKLFESLNLLTYCLDLPEGSLCLGRVLNVYNDHLLTILENNFRKFILSHLLVNPYFWGKDSLVDFLAAKKAQSIPLMNGVSLTVDGEVIKGQLTGLPFRFEIPEEDKVESLRLQTGLFGNDSEAKWVGYGVEWVQRDAKKDMVCGLGVEIFKSQSAFMLNYLRDRKKQEKLKKIKGEDPKPLPGIWYRPFRGLKTPFQAYGFCAPLEEDPRVSGQYFVDFKNSKPLKYPYQIGQ